MSPAFITSSNFLAADRLHPWGETIG